MCLLLRLFKEQRVSSDKLGINRKSIVLNIIRNGIFLKSVSALCYIRQWIQYNWKIDQYATNISYLNRILSAMFKQPYKNCGLMEAQKMGFGL